uniref:CD109 antigen-like n=1 Tax=Styela clava TaxID=7725 RepID=UPI00193A2E2C|nr:CD109 antigen-like [Styela clava]
MLKLVATVVVYLLFAGDTAAAQNTYAVYIPKSVQRGIPFKIGVKIIQSENPVIVEATLKSEGFNETSVVTIESGETQTISIKGVPLDHEEGFSVQIEVVGTDSVTGEELFFNKTGKFELDLQDKAFSIFIQTDKAIYQPGQTIKFRAVVTTRDLKPLKDADGTSPVVKYSLHDPSGNTVLLNSSAMLVNGVVGSQFTLGRHASLGTWQVQYTVYKDTETIDVTVEEYKLPKVRIQIKTNQKYLHPKSTELSGDVGALFTFGQPVKGSGRIEFTIVNYYDKDSQQTIVQKFWDFDGTAFFSIQTSDIKSILGWDDTDMYAEPLKMTAYVKDKNTGEEYKKTTSVALKTQRLRFEAVATPHIIKPGFPYIAYIKVSETDGTLLSEKERNNFPMLIDIEYSYEWVWDDHNLGNRKKEKKISVPVEVDENGFAKLDIIADTSDFIRADFKVEVPSSFDENQFWLTWVANAFLSPSNSFIEISTDDLELEIGDKANITIHTTDISENYWFMIIAKGNIVKQELYSPPDHVKQSNFSSFEYSFDVTMEMIPNVLIVVSFVREDSEIVADSVKIPVRAALANKVTLTTNTDQTDVRLPVNITINAEPDSFFGLRAIDQSVLLLKSGNDITQSKIFRELDEYGRDKYDSHVGWDAPWANEWWPYPIHGNNVAEVFENARLVVLTNALVYQTVKLDPCRPVNSSGHHLEDDSLGTPALPRNYFPETWIWTDGYIGKNGSTTLNYKTPDTITSWELSSFAISDTKGLGVTRKNSEIRVFRNFFISLNLPPTMIRGETLNMRATIFNYFDKDIEVTVALEENEWYDLIIIGDDKIAAGPIRNIKIPKKDSATVVFPITFKKAGNAKIFVKALTAQAGDAVERTMVVKPEGIQKTESHSSIIDKAKNDSKAESVIFPVTIPEYAVVDSAHVKFSVSGNILGNALSNLGNLLKMPSGCGEQTMVSFAPDVYISLYLDKTGQLEGETKQKSEDHIRGGFINELRYQRYDGSFSAFGKSDTFGSTWLTAFVVKCFIAAKELNSDYIGKWPLENAISFLLEQQNDNGTFIELGKLLNTNMQGGVNSKETLSAYILISLLEKNYTTDQPIEETVNKARKYLESRINSVKDLYSLSIMTYALALTGSDKATDMLQSIDKMSTVKGNTKFWKKSIIGISKCEARKERCPFSNEKSSASSIEMTAYILLAYVKKGRKDVMPIVRWLVEQRGAFGGYQSTQDTVIAIHALATVAAFFSERDMKLEVTVKHSDNKDFMETFQLEKDNQIVLQTTKLPAISGTVLVSATGHGFADVQLTVWYNLPVGPKTDDPFIVDVKMKEKYGGKMMSLVACSRINDKRRDVVNRTGMFVITGKLPSGYTANEKEATTQNEDTKLVELVDNEITGYFDELPKGKTMCMNLRLTRFAEVSGIKPQLFQAYDYYEPAKTTSLLYSLPEPDKGRICASCGSDCVGCPPKQITLDYCKYPCLKKMKAFDNGYCDFPCPDYTDGLYYDPGSHIYKLMQKYSKHTKRSVPNGAGSSELYMGPPATLLDGENEYIECSSSKYLKQMLSSKKGFTISLLVHLSDDPPYHKRITLFTIGAKKSTKPYVVFEKPQWSYYYTIRVNLNGFEYTVDDIDSYDEIKLNKWTMLTVKLRKGRAEVFLNNKRKGKSSRKRRATRKITSDITLKIGQPHIVKGKQQGNFKGLVSSLHIWSRYLNNPQILDFYYYVNPMMSIHDPRLSNTRVQELLPRTLRRCFTDPYYDSSDLKKRAGYLATPCDDNDPI